jgi:hypothetical protein
VYDLLVDGQLAGRASVTGGNVLTVDMATGSAVTRPAPGVAFTDLCAEYLHLTCDVKSCTLPSVTTFFVQLPGYALSKRRCRQHWQALHDILIECGLVMRYPSVQTYEFVKSAAR